MPIRVLDDWGGKASDIAKGIVWAADHGADVISLSLGSPNFSSTESDAVDYAVSRGCLVVASAGNNGTTSPNYPAYLEECLAVGASDKADGRVSFSQYGSWVDVAAPGTQIMSTVPGGYAYKGGTSMATPFVSGLAGLLFSRSGANAKKVRQAIEQTCDPAGSWTTHGRINASRALAALTPSAPQPGSPPPTDASAGKGGKKEAAPKGYQLTSGATLDSPANSLVWSDDNRLKLSSKGAGLKAVLDFYVTTKISGLGALERLEIELEAGLSDAGEVTAFLYNWGAKSWTWIGKARLDTGDTSVVFTRENPQKYVSADGSVRVRFFREAGRWQGFELTADQVRFCAQGKAAAGPAGESPSEQAEQAVSKAWKKLKSLVK
jgi:thermitase